MSWFIKIFGGEVKVVKEACHQEKREKLPEAEELLRAKKIDHELFFAKKSSRNNGQVALQVLTRKKWYQKHLKYFDGAVEAVRDIVNKVIKDIAEEQDGTENMPDTLHTSMSFEEELDQTELLAELEMLKNSLFELDRVEERVSCPKVSSTASPSYPESAPQAQSKSESDSANSSSGVPAILVTAPSREDIYASGSNMTIADAIKERRPSSTPIVVGRKLVKKKQ
ncbi:charged multivesicular body protein 4b-like [Chaetodon trifascialis]|uniref:charged multivesicular body protein 4b-like n=1 Tax=Chaetodon trifascialis TaxID=109706 RepID=UPI00399190CC